MLLASGRQPTWNDLGIGAGLARRHPFARGRIVGKSDLGEATSAGQDRLYNLGCICQVRYVRLLWQISRRSRPGTMPANSTPN